MRLAAPGPSPDYLVGRLLPFRHTGSVLRTGLGPVLGLSPEHRWASACRTGVMVNRTAPRVKAAARNPELFRHISHAVPRISEDLHRSSPEGSGSRADLHRVLHLGGWPASDAVGELAPSADPKFDVHPLQVVVDLRRPANGHAAWLLCGSRPATPSSGATTRSRDAPDRPP